MRRGPRRVADQLCANRKRDREGIDRQTLAAVAGATATIGSVSGSTGQRECHAQRGSQGVCRSHCECPRLCHGLRGPLLPPLQWTWAASSSHLRARPARQASPARVLTSDGNPPAATAVVTLGAVTANTASEAASPSGIPVGQATIIAVFAVTASQSDDRGGRRWMPSDVRTLPAMLAVPAAP